MLAFRALGLNEIHGAHLYVLRAAGSQSAFRIFVTKEPSRVAPVPNLIKAVAAAIPEQQ